MLCGGVGGGGGVEGGEGGGGGGSEPGRVPGLGGVTGRERGMEHWEVEVIGFVVREGWIFFCVN